MPRSLTANSLAATPCLLLCLASCLVLSGCSSKPTRAQYIERADAICAGTLRSIRSLTPPSVSGDAAARSRSLAAYLEQALPLVRAQARRLQALPDPQASAAQAVQLRRYLEGVERADAGLAALDAAAGRGDLGAVEQLEARLSDSDLGSAAARAFGLKVCGEAGATVG